MPLDSMAETSFDVHPITPLLVFPLHTNRLSGLLDGIREHAEHSFVFFFGRLQRIAKFTKFGSYLKDKTTCQSK